MRIPNWPRTGYSRLLDNKTHALWEIKTVSDDEMAGGRELEALKIEHSSSIAFIIHAPVYLPAIQLHLLAEGECTNAHLLGNRINLGDFALHFWSIPRPAVYPPSLSILKTCRTPMGPFPPTIMELCLSLGYRGVLCGEMGGLMREAH